MLHIINSEANARLLRESSIEGQVIACEDLIYEGPLKGELSTEAMMAERLAYFCKLGFEEPNVIRSRFQARTRLLQQYKQHSSIVLWLNHSVNDQLLLLQHLHWFEREDIGHIEVSIISPDRLPATRNVHDFGQLSDDQFSSLYKRRLEVSVMQLEMATEYWQRIGSDDPLDLAQFSKPDLRCFPKMAEAFTRLLQQYPSKLNGLSRSERQILEVLTTGETDPEKIFRRSQNKEDEPFLDHVGFWMTVSRLMNAEQPAIELVHNDRDERVDSLAPRELNGTKLRITDFGRAVLKYKADWIQQNGIDRWVCGVHLRDGNIWRWDPKQTMLNKTYV